MKIAKGTNTGFAILCFLTLVRCSYDRETSHRLLGFTILGTSVVTISEELKITREKIYLTPEGEKISYTTVKSRFLLSDGTYNTELKFLSLQKNYLFYYFPGFSAWLAIELNPFSKTFIQNPSLSDFHKIYIFRNAKLLHYEDHIQQDLLFFDKTNNRFLFKKNSSYFSLNISHNLNYFSSNKLDTTDSYLFTTLIQNNITFGNSLCFNSLKDTIQELKNHNLIPRNNLKTILKLDDFTIKESSLSDDSKMSLLDDNDMYFFYKNNNMFFSGKKSYKSSQGITHLEMTQYKNSTLYYLEKFKDSFIYNIRINKLKI